MHRNTVPHMAKNFPSNILNNSDLLFKIPRFSVLEIHQLWFLVISFSFAFLSHLPLSLLPCSFSFPNLFLYYLLQQCSCSSILLVVSDMVYSPVFALWNILSWRKCSRLENKESEKQVARDQKKKSYLRSAFLRQQEGKQRIWNTVLFILPLSSGKTSIS